MAMHADFIFFDTGGVDAVLLLCRKEKKKKRGERGNDT